MNYVTGPPPAKIAPAPLPFHPALSTAIKVYKTDTRLDLFIAS